MLFRHVRTSMLFEFGLVPSLSDIAYIMCGDPDDDHAKNKTIDHCGGDDDDEYSDEILHNGSIPDFELCDDDLSYATRTLTSPIMPLYDMNTETNPMTCIVFLKECDHKSGPEYADIRPIARSFIQLVRASAPPEWNDQVSDEILANVINESFPQLISHPELLDQFLAFIVAHRQLSSQSTVPCDTPLVYHPSVPTNVTSRKQPTKKKISNKPSFISQKP